MLRGRWEKPLAPLFIPSMARRVHTTELGCIACNELSELGAGKEGWLVENPSLICALDTDSLALANRSFVLVLGWSENGDPYNSPVKIRPTLSQIEAERITAVEWLVFDEIRVLAVGTSSGYLMIYSLGADLIHKQVSELGGFLVCINVIFVWLEDVDSVWVRLVLCLIIWNVVWLCFCLHVEKILENEENRKLEFCLIRERKEKKKKGWSCTE